MFPDEHLRQRLKVSTKEVYEEFQAKTEQDTPQSHSSQQWDTQESRGDLADMSSDGPNEEPAMATLQQADWSGTKGKEQHMASLAILPSFLLDGKCYIDVEK